MFICVKSWNIDDIAKSLTKFSKFSTFVDDSQHCMSKSSVISEKIKVFFWNNVAENTLWNYKWTFLTTCLFVWNHEISKLSQKV